MIVANIVPKLAIKAQMVKYFTLIYKISAKTGVFPLQICKIRGIKIISVRENMSCRRIVVHYKAKTLCLK